MELFLTLAVLFRARFLGGILRMTFETWSLAREAQVCLLETRGIRDVTGSRNRLNSTKTATCD